MDTGLAAYDEQDKNGNNILHHLIYLTELTDDAEKNAKIADMVARIAKAQPELLGQTNSTEGTALAAAVNSGNVELTKSLLKAGANPNDKIWVNDGHGLLEEAVLQGNEKLAELLFQQKDLKVEENSITLQALKKQRGQPIVEHLYAFTTEAYTEDSVRYTVLEKLEKALDKDDIDAVKRMEETGELRNVGLGELNKLLSEFKEKNPKGNKSFSYAQDIADSAAKQGEKLTQAITNNDQTLATELIKNGAPLDGVDGTGLSILERATYLGQAYVVKELMVRGVDPNSTYAKEKNPLSIAIANNDVQMIKVLVKAGAHFDENLTTALAKQLMNGNSPQFVNDITHEVITSKDIEFKSALMGELIKSGNKDLLKHFLDKGLDPNFKDAKGNSLLAMSIKEENQILFDLLVQRGANINNIDAEGNSALMLAVEKGHETMMNDLVKMGADVNAQNNAGENVVIKALTIEDFDPRRDTTLAMLKKGAKIEVMSGEKDNEGKPKATPIRDENGVPVFMLAVQTDDYFLMDTLAGMGPNVMEAKDKDGNTALLKFVENFGKNSPSAKQEKATLGHLIKQGADINAVNNAGETVLSLAIADEPVVISTVFSYTKPKPKLDGKAKNELVQDLISKGARLRKEETGSCLYQALKSGNLELFETLVKSGGDINAQDAKGNTALSLALDNNDGESAIYLINKGATLSKEQIAEKGPRFLYTASNLNDQTLYKTLVKSGIDINMQDTKGNTALSLALDNSSYEFAMNLMAQGATLSKEQIAEKGPRFLYKTSNLNDQTLYKTLVKSGLDINMKDAKGNTALSLALHDRRLGAIIDLINKGATLSKEQIAEKGVKLLLLEAEWSNGQESFKTLIKSGVDINMQDPEGNTALSLAVVRQNPEMTKNLLRAGADPSIKDKDGHTVIDVAKKQNISPKIIEQLEEKAKENLGQKFDKKLDSKLASVLQQIAKGGNLEEAFSANKLDKHLVKSDKSMQQLEDSAKALKSGKSSLSDEINRIKQSMSEKELNNKKSEYIKNKQSKSGKSEVIGH